MLFPLASQDQVCRSANRKTQNCLLMPSVTLLLIAIASSIGWFPYSELRAEPGYKSKSGNIASTSPQFIVYTSHAQLKLQYGFQHQTTDPGDDNHLVAAQFTIRF
jgi:hypothetical protein